MPRAIEIYTDETEGALKCDVTTPRRNGVYRLGWDSPAEIWQAMNDKVPTLICSQIRLVRSDGEVLMVVREETDAHIQKELQEYVREAEAETDRMLAPMRHAIQEIRDLKNPYV